MVAMRKKVTWKVEKLSMAGRVTLCKAVLSALPIYTMQSTTLPKSICNEIEIICRKFIQGSTFGNRRIHLINWNQVCQPLDNGGLGIKHMKSMNEALLMKLAWGLITEKEALWVQVLRRKYRVKDGTLLRVKIGPRPSPIQRGICRIWPHVLRGTRWIISNSHQAKFWKDLLLEEDTPLIEKVVSFIPENL